MKAFASYHPVILLIYFLSVVSIAIVTKNPAIRLLALGGGFCFCSILEYPREILRNLAFYIPLFFLTAIVTPLFFHNGVTPLFFLNGKAVTLEAVFSGCNTAALLVSILYWMQCYRRIMTSDKVLFLCGILAPRLSLLLSRGLGFVPLLLERFRKVHQAQKAMGLYTSRSYVDRIAGMMRVSSSTVTWALEHVVHIGDSMRAKGYGLKGRTSFFPFQFTGKDGCCLFIIVAFFAVVLIGGMMHSIHFSFYPRMSAFPHTFLARSAYAAFGILCFLPFVLEIKENIKWNYYRSKI